MLRALILSLITGLLVSGCGSHSTQHAGPAAAEVFLARYVAADGRVVRRDQGGDTVSEGQAYGMLIAEVADRPATVRAIWSWTRAHLRRDDGLLISDVNDAGDVVNAQPATDADTLAAYALLRYDGDDEDTLHAAGRRLATAVLDGESTTLDGQPVLVAGPWAKAMSPPVVNPSYLMPDVFAALAHHTGDDRWQQAATFALTLLRQLTNDGRTLPTDWARVSSDGLVPIPDPGGNTPVQYGLDAARLPVWLGTSCTPAARRLAARWWSTLRHDDRAAALALSPSGAPTNTATNPLPLLAAGTAARAAGDATTSQTLRSRAAQQSRRTPTYYGDAWLALSGALLDRTLDVCREATSG